MTERPSANEIVNALFGLFRLCAREAPNSIIMTPEMRLARDVLDKLAAALPDEPDPLNTVAYGKKMVVPRESPRMTCARCNKRLSRKTVRVIAGEMLCGVCVFAPRKSIPTRSAET